MVEGIIPNNLVQRWRELVGDQVIGQAEIYPVVLAKLHWRNVLSNRRVLYFIDNDSARFALVKMNTPSPASITLVHTYYNVEAEVPSYSWFARVPSKSNPADWPSRGEAELAVSKFNATLINIPELNL